MLKQVKRLLLKAYMGAQKNAISLRLLLLLKEIGLPRRVNYWLTCIENRNLRKEPSEAMLKSRTFYEANRARANAVSDMLADEMSKKVWGGGYFNTVPCERLCRASFARKKRNTLLTISSG